MPDFDSVEYTLNMKSLQIKKLYDKGWEKVKPSKELHRSYQVTNEPTAMFVKKFPEYDGKVFLNLDLMAVTDPIVFYETDPRTVVGGIKSFRDKDCLIAYTFKIFRSWKKIPNMGVNSKETENGRLQKELLEIIATCFHEIEFIGFKPLVHYVKSYSRIWLSPHSVYREISMSRQPRY